MQYKIFEKLFLGRSYVQIHALAKEFIAEALPGMLNPPVIAKLREAQQKGHHTAILSSSPDFLVALCAKELGVNQWFAATYEVDEQQNFTHISSFMEGMDKYKRLSLMMKQLGLPPQQTTAYSDSIEDLVFLTSAGKSIAVNPDKKLREYAQNYGWQIIG